MSSREYWEHMVRTRHARERRRRGAADPLYRILVGFGVALMAGGALIAYGAALYTFVAGGQYWALGFLGAVLGFGFTAATVALVLLGRDD